MAIRITNLLLMFAALLKSVLNETPLDKCCIVDMSHTLDTDSIRFPTDPEFIFTILTRGIEPEGFWLELNKFETPEHIGTHMDAPSHFARDRWRVHEIPAQRLVGAGVVVDVRNKVKRNPDYRLSVSDLRKWEMLYGRIPDGAIVFMWSGWDVRYPNKTSTFNSNTPEDIRTWHFPGFHPSAMSWLVQNRNISMIGVDTPSVDYAQTSVYDVHQIMCNASIMGLENVNNLAKIPPSRSLIVALPVKLRDGSGGPVRIISIFCDTDKSKYC
ncbi:kynurenine formamidase-like [Biomphalaria glabrata]|uniref:Kynurenine formamidase-like n=1 Tax=Biomphalaria glabrata TaxID=6526 RepID=A0A9W3AH39_BIOGL|nr:kynurenine formamidase-like [Biomphalaria glabrata]XP_055886489.1 kynurenine formamidase-like [Biomphalaria glabrata]XP_055886490.1 kynurenine formamidase-like [Biomphalaria glabrata]XP_055886491.1 kynurenine formamidase-like [Biomphalaria glabrata]